MQGWQFDNGLRGLSREIDVMAAAIQPLIRISIDLAVLTAESLHLFCCTDAGVVLRRTIIPSPQSRRRYIVQALVVDATVTPCHPLLHHVDFSHLTVLLLTLRCQLDMFVPTQVPGSQLEAVLFITHTCCSDTPVKPIDWTQVCVLDKF